MNVAAEPVPFPPLATPKTLKSRKRCGGCGRIRWLKFFGKNKNRSDGLQPKCRDCSNGYYRGWRKRNPGLAARTALNSFTRFYSTPHGLAVHRVSRARTVARQLKLPFDLDVPWLEEKIKRGVCEATGLRFSMLIHHGKGHFENSSIPSLDRKVAAKGYTKKNVKVVVWIYNRARGGLPDADFLAMCRAVVRRSRGVKS